MIVVTCTVPIDPVENNGNKKFQDYIFKNNCLLKYDQITLSVVDRMTEWTRHKYQQVVR